MSEPLFFEDREGSDVADDGDFGPAKESAGSFPQNSSEREAKRQPVWVDEDDEGEEVNLLQVPRRKKLRKDIRERNISGTEYAKRIRDFYKEKGTGVWSAKGGWAELPSERKEKRKPDAPTKDKSDDQEHTSDEDSDLDETARSLLTSAGTVLAKRKRTNVEQGRAPGEFFVKSGVLDLRILPHANAEDPNRAESRCVEFHPSGQMLLTAGLDKTLRIFLVDGETCSKVQGIHINRFPIRSAKFVGEGTEVVLTGRRRYFHQFDLNTGQVRMIQTLQHHEERSWEKFEVSHDGSKLGFIGQQGKIVLMSNKSKQEMGQLRHNGRVSSAAFAPAGENENHVWTSTTEGTVYLWDVRKTISCVDKHRDEGVVHNTCLAVSNTHYATGSDSGVVNLYPTHCLNSSSSDVFGIRTEKPVKSFLNLTTEINDVQFNADGQLMAFSSHEKKGAVRIVHTPSMTVFRNWPSSRTNVRRVCKLAFSPGSGYLAIGNDKGDVHMLRLKAFAPR